MTAFITGGSQIGLGIARALARQGLKVALADIDTAALAQAAEELASVTEVAAIELDVRDRAAFANAADQVERRLGTVSVLVNNAERGARHHVAFGFGPHHCLGQNLARMELQIVFDTLFRRVPSLELAVDVDELPFKDDANIYGLYQLPVAW
ncbi:SDR family NAD(P)-dependent oxidoreductase [Nonomuraea mesophila]|nr:SDR family NAD(P)-dependent oxidoreductase [Nonomuraea mesophila]